MPPSQENGEKWLAEHPEESTRVLDALERIVVEYMSLQARLPLIAADCLGLLLITTDCPRRVLVAAGETAADCR